MKRWLHGVALLLACGTVAAHAIEQARSPYLRQYADHPVDGRPWTDATLARAREADKPIFLSIGYLTCRGCRVMNRETFLQPDVYRFLNAHFINILVDREERPDIDRLYQTFVAGTTGRGGWPLNVWLTPDLQPHLGGTYFPPQDRPGQRGFLTVASHRISLSIGRNAVNAAAKSLPLILTSPPPCTIWGMHVGNTAQHPRQCYGVHSPCPHD